MGALPPDVVLRPRVLIGAWCSAIFDALKAHGVSEVVISPGSRNTPLTLAALRSGCLRCHSIVDERSAAFFALGLARGSQRPVALVCTSGTAAAHYYPAVIEASYDGLPLVVISADRPEELQNCGAPQTIAQADLFGDFVRGKVSLTAPQESTKAFAFIGEKVAALTKSATGVRPGPVHINVPLRKPLEPSDPEGDSEEAKVQQLREACARSIVKDVQASSPREYPPVDHLISARHRAQRPLLVAGPLSPLDLSHVQQAADLLEAPLLQEYGPGSTAGLEFLGPRLLRDGGADLLVHFGPPAVSSSWARALESFQGVSLIYSGTEFRDPSRRAQRVVVAPLERVTQALMFARSEDSSPFHASDVLESSVRARLEHSLTSALRPAPAGERLHEPLAVRQILSCCSLEHSLVLGNSLSLRLASWVWPSEKARPHPHTARGVNGIDGMLAWSLGIAESTGRPTLAVLGDVTAAHDLGSLQLLVDRKTPLVLVVLDNGGGRIFDHLPVRDGVTDSEMLFWTTPPQLDFPALAGAFGLEFASVTKHDDVTHVVGAALKAGKPTFIVVPTEPASTVEFLQQMRKSWNS